MMNYEIFKKVIMEKLPNYLPEEIKAMEMKVNTVNKVNVTLDSINFIDRSQGEVSLAPNLYINEMYRHYQDCMDVEEVLKRGAEFVVNGFNNRPDNLSGQSVTDAINSSEAKNNIIFQLINTVQNERLLKTVPNRQYLDMSIIYRWVVNADDSGIQSVIVTNSLTEQLDLSEEELFRLATVNTERLLPTTVTPMTEVMKKLRSQDGMPEEMVEMMLDSQLEDIPDEQMQWVISNDRGINGAIGMLYEDNLHKLAKKLDSDLYILPSSIHEVLAMKATGDPYELAQMVSEINSTQVQLEERLSNNVYHYDKNLRKVTLATDVPNKRLDNYDVA